MTEKRSDEPSRKWKTLSICAFAVVIVMTFVVIQKSRENKTQADLLHTMNEAIDIGYEAQIKKLNHEKDSLAKRLFDAEDKLGLHQF